jgi:protein RecA
MADKSTDSKHAAGSAEKTKALSLAIAQIEKTVGKGAIMRMGQETWAKVDFISTGAVNLDAAIGVGGIPRGRITEIYGPESSGKTTLALHVAANAQKNGGVAAYIDAEHALDVEYAKKLGVDVENLLVSQPDTGEEGLEIAEILVRSGAVDVIVIDSVAALVPKAEIEGDMGDSHVGLQARLMSQALRKLAGSINRSKTSVVFINQLREKIGVMFGNPETTTGGPGAQVLRVGAARRAAHRGGEGARRRHRQPRARQGGEEQGRPAVPSGRVRHHVQRGDQPRGAAGGHRRRSQHHRQERRVVFVRQGADRPGAGEREALLERQSGHGFRG